MEEETYPFYYCTHMQDTWNQVPAYFTDFSYLTYFTYHLFQLISHISQLTPQTAIFSFYNINNDTFLIQNQPLLLLKLHVYNARKCRFLSFNNFLNDNFI